MATHILKERHGSVLLVTMNRPEKRNALGRGLREGLRRAFDEFDAAVELLCAVLTGSGSAFCAGLDLKEMADGQIAVPPEEWSLLLGSRGVVQKPVIAAANGPAFGGGFLLAQECDLCVAADTASFGITEVKRGRGAPWAVPLIDMLPQRVMMELLLTGDPMSAYRAYEVGLVNAVVPRSELLAAALTLAARITANAPLSVLAAKEMVHVATGLGRSREKQMAGELFERVYNSADAREGPRAYIDGRPPVWQGV